MKILLIADVHNRPEKEQLPRRLTLLRLKRIIKKTPCDLIVFLGDTVHGPAFKGRESEYEFYLRQVLDLTGNTPFATVFGNHDDECAITKDEILKVTESYKNSLTKGRNYVLDIQGETLLFIDSGSYYEGEGSYYDTVKQEVIDWALKETEGKKAILFQHIIIPDIAEYVEKRGKRWRFKKGVKYKGGLGERPCHPSINTGELSQLAPQLKGAAFGHDHNNSFEVDICGVKIIQCPGCGSNSYDKFRRSAVKLLNTATMETKLLRI